MPERDVVVPFAYINIPQSRVERTLITHRNNRDFRSMDGVFDGTLKLADLLAQKRRLTLTCERAQDGAIQLLADEEILKLEKEYVCDERTIRGMINHYSSHYQTSSDLDTVVKALLGGQGIGLRIVSVDVPSFEFPS